MVKAESARRIYFTVDDCRMTAPVASIPLPVPARLHMQPVPGVGGGGGEAGPGKVAFLAAPPPPLLLKGVIANVRSASAFIDTTKREEEMREESWMTGKQKAPFREMTTAAVLIKFGRYPTAFTRLL